MEILNNNDVAWSRTKKLHPFWQENINLYRFLGLPFITVASTNAYIEVIENRFGYDKARFSVIKDRILIGRRMRINFLKFAFSIFLLSVCAWYIHNDPTHWNIFLFTFISVAFSIYISYFYSIESEFKKTVHILFRRTAKEEHESVMNEHTTLAAKKLESSTHDLRQVVEVFELQKEKNARSKNAIIVVVNDRTFEFASKEILLIEYFKDEVKDYKSGEMKINFHGFRHADIVSSIMTKYQLEYKEQSLLGKLRRMSFLNLNINKKAKNKDINSQKVREIQDYLILAGYNRAENRLKKHVDTERL
ncbi:hypothetical protein [Rhizosphaericola mali]|uniref:Uncharacterized protein n=1 Tax=Rhizosphaericola mali TaxID=2545455 RepID=A0A5P2G0F4_9BACT|nr:hypothetical protein [Rhizosphaericola mali]QES87609.1 hypothetical protein E0W69_002640 [Rhizosphaericola mali]